MKTPPNILIVDDELGSRVTLEDILEDKGFDIFSVDSGPKAISVVEKENIDIILMDYKMPGMNGLEVFQKIRATNPNLKVIFITAYYDEQSLQTEKSDQILGICHKPVNIPELINLIEGVQTT